jgi:hypothetical protein
MKFIKFAVSLLSTFITSVVWAQGPGPNAKLCSTEGGVEMYCDYEQASVWFAITPDKINAAATANGETKGALVDPPSMFAGLIKTAIDERVFKPIYDKQPAIARKVLRIIKRNSADEKAETISNQPVTVLSPGITVNWPADIAVRVYGKMQFQSDYNRGVYTPNPADGLFRIELISNDGTVELERATFTWGELGCATRTAPMLPFLNCTTSTATTIPNGGYQFNVFRVNGNSFSAISGLKVRIVWEPVDKRSPPIYFVVERVEFTLFKTPDGSVFSVPGVES